VDLSAARAVTLRGIVAMIVAVLAAACDSTSSAPPRGSTGQPLDSVERETMSKDEKTAVTAVDNFWRRHFPELFGSAYRSPRVVGGYTGTNGPRCAGEPSVPFNAFYCLAGDFLA